MVDDNKLEQALRAAAADPACRPDFYRLLLDSNVYVIGRTEAPGDGERTLSEDDQVSLMQWPDDDGGSKLPFFTSEDALRKAIDQHENYLALPARSLFEMTRGARLLLNPGSDYGKEFLPGEIESLLTSDLTQAPRTRVVEQTHDVLLGQPAEYPQALVDALRSFLARRPTVDAAYLALMHDPSLDAEPTLLVGLAGDGDLDTVMHEAGSVAADTLPPGVGLDMCRVDADETGVAGYMRSSVEPFYQRDAPPGRKSWLRSLFGKTNG